MKEKEFVQQFVLRKVSWWRRTISVWKLLDIIMDAIGVYERIENFYKEVPPSPSLECDYGEPSSTPTQECEDED